MPWLISEAVTVSCEGALFLKPQYRTSAAFPAYCGGRVIVKHGIAGGRGTSYDADMIARGMGLAFAT